MTLLQSILLQSSARGGGVVNNHPEKPIPVSLISLIIQQIHNRFAAAAIVSGPCLFRGLRSPQSIDRSIDRSREGLPGIGSSFPAEFVIDSMSVDLARFVQRGSKNADRVGITRAKVKVKSQGRKTKVQERREGARAKVKVKTGQNGQRTDSIKRKSMKANASQR
jgi:hypothetical protein